MSTLVSTAAGWRARVAGVVDALERFPLSLLLLMARIGVAAVFWNAGQTKIASWQTTVALFAQEYQVPLLPPELAALLATTVELTCPVLLVLGLATRLATLPMLGMIFMIQTFVYPQAWTEHLIWTSLLLLILTRGPGVLSLDHLFDRLLSRT
jgi:putative oxidoreductase